MPRPSSSASAFLVAFCCCCVCVGCGDDDGSDPGGATADGSGGGGPAGCTPSEITTPDGGCAAVGVTTCAPQFHPSEDGGCEPILPPAPCVWGAMAPPGEASCRPVAPCGEARYPDAPSEGTPRFVDAQYLGAEHDGTAERPWRTIQEAIDAAEPGDTVLIAAGTYLESIWNGAKRVRIEGRCPELVRLVGVSPTLGALEISSAGDGTEVRGLSVEGPAYGVTIAGVSDVVLDRLWIHDTGERGLDVDDALGAASFTLSGSLVEATTVFGIFAAGVGITIEDSVVRDTRPKADLTNGPGMMVRPGVDGAPAVLVMRRSLFERNLLWGAMVLGSQASIEATVVRDTMIGASRPIGGRGISIGNGEGEGAPPDVQRASVTIRQSLLERNVEGGIVVRSSDVLVEDTVVRDTLANPVDGTMGLGIYAKEQSLLDIRTSLVDRARVVAIYARESQAFITSSWIRDTQSLAGEGSVGDGISILTFDANAAGGRVAGSRVTRSARAGLSSFSARVEVQSSEFECNAVDLDGETNPEAAPFEFVDLGGNTCPCDGSEECQVQSAHLAAPSIE